MTNKVIKEHTEIGTAEVDAVGGAKLEPEERPLDYVTTLQPDAQVLSDGREIQGMATATVIETQVGQEMKYYKKQCGRCKFFNQPRGQQEIFRIDEFGSPEERTMLNNARVIFTEPGGDELVHPSRVWDDETKEIFKTAGVCETLSMLHPLKEEQIVFPFQEGCPKEVHWYGEEIPFMYEPRTAEDALYDKQTYDALMRTAAGHIKTLAESKVKK